MPVGGWQGFQYSDNSQAVAVANVMKQFTDRGVAVWLRFAHEVNWYQFDGTYTGGPAEFQEGWAVMAKAIKDICPEVQMFFTPNVAGAQSDYDAFFPQDPTTVNVIGMYIIFFLSSSSSPLGILMSLW
jgi:hypothetical protein